MPGGVLDGAPWLERVPAEDRERARRRVPPRAGAGRARLARRARRGRHRPLGAHPHGAGLEGRRPADGPRRDDRGRHRRGDRAHGARRARGRVPDARRALHRLPVAPHHRRHLPLRVAGVAGHARLGLRGDARAGRPSSSAWTTPRTWRSSSATGSGRCARSARAPPPTAPGAATARSCGWRRPSAPCAAPAARRSRWSASSRDISERKSAELELAHRALHDGLTGLPNRTLFLDRLGQALRRSRRRDRGVAVVFLDLDRFKVVNDSLGHKAGDRLLVDVAMRLSSALRPSDTLARFGGDELTLLCEDIGDADDARVDRPAPARHLRRALPRAGRRGLPAGEHRHRALARRLRGARGPHPRRRRRDVPRQGPRPGRRDLRRGHAPGRARPPRAGGRAAPRHRARRAAPALPAAGLARRRAHRGLRGARALGAPRARPRAARVVHPAGRGDRAHRPHRRLGPARGVRHAAADHRRDRDGDPAGLGQRLAAPAPAARLRRAGARRARRQRPRAELAWSSRSPRARSWRPAPRRSCAR